MRPSFTSFLAFIMLSGLMSACGGGRMAGSSEPERKKEKKEDSGDQSASDPAVVTGAYLACEISAKDATRVKSGEEAIGCNIMANNRRVNAGGQDRFEFSSERQSAQRNPSDSNTKSGYQALFINLTSETRETKYIAKMYAKGTLVKEISCSGDKLPCVAPVEIHDVLQLQSQGIWDPQNDTVTKPALSPDCPTDPDRFCDAQGNLLATLPPVDSRIKSQCKDTAQKIISGIMNNIFGGGGLEDLLTKAFDKPPTSSPGGYSLNRASACVVQKRKLNETTSKYLVVGARCSSVMVNDAGMAKGMIFKNSDIKSPATFESQLAQFACP